MGEGSLVSVSDVLRVFQRYWALIVLLTAVGLSVAAAMLVFVVKPSYEASARLFVSTQSLGTANELLQGSTYTQARMTSYAEIANDPIVLDPVIAQLGLDTTADALAGHVKATAESNQLIIDIVATDGDAQMSADIVNAVAENLSEVISEKIEAPIAGSDAIVNVTTTRVAQPPASPSWPKPWLILTVGGLMGLLAGIGFAFLLQAGDSRVRNIDEVRKLVPYPVIGLVLQERNFGRQSVMARMEERGMFSEAYRSARTNLEFIDAQGEARRVLLVTSTVPGEGKSTAAVALATSLSEAGNRVALVDADLRKPQIATMLGLDDTVGLTDLLLNRVEVGDVLQPVGETGKLWVLPSGSVPPNPAELLGSPQFAQLIELLRKHFDYVVIDSPPVLPVSDALVLSRLADGVILVVAVESVRRPQLETSLSTLQQVDAPVIGVIANRLTRSGVDAYSYYGQGAYGNGPVRTPQVEAREELPSWLTDDADAAAPVNAEAASSRATKKAE